MAQQPVSREFAEAFVALAAAPINQPQLSAAVARKALDGLSQSYQQQIAQYWEDANKEALRLLVLVMQNNPKKTRDQILSRVDVQAVLREPYVLAAAKSEELLHKAWGEAETLAVKHAKADFKLLGEDWKGYELDLALRDALVADLHANAKAMRKRYREAMSDPATARDRLTMVAEDGKRRSRYSIQTAVWGVATQVRDTATFKAGLNKMWVAVMDTHTCSHCKALNGMVVGPGDVFPADAGDTVLRVYRDALYGPPRHPNCRCVIVPTKLKKSKSKSGS